MNISIASPHFGRGSGQLNGSFREFKSDASPFSKHSGKNQTNITE
jgi:hypothetical protein